MADPKPKRELFTVLKLSKPYSKMTDAEKDELAAHIVQQTKATAGGSEKG
jgi:hypothetical protein